MATEYKTPVYVRECQKRYIKRKLENNPEYAETLRERQRQWVKERLKTDEDFRKKHLERVSAFGKKQRIQRKTSAFDDLFSSAEYKTLLTTVQSALPDVTDTPEEIDAKIRDTLLETHIQPPNTKTAKTVLEHMVTSNKRQPMSILKATLFHILRPHWTYDKACELMTLGKPTLLSIYKALQDALKLPHVDPNDTPVQPLKFLMETSDGRQIELDGEISQKILALLPSRPDKVTQVTIRVQ